MRNLVQKDFPRLFVRVEVWILADVYSFINQRDFFRDFDWLTIQKFELSILFDEMNFFKETLIFVFHGGSRGETQNKCAAKGRMMIMKINSEAITISLKLDRFLNKFDIKGALVLDTAKKSS